MEMMKVECHLDARHLRRNIKAHDRIARKYSKVHGEIYNEIEQERLRETISSAVEAITTASRTKIALDFGCGAGNLTKHLSDLGCDVLACDVSRGFIDLVGSKSFPTRVEPILINGTDLGNIESFSVDIVATYSVLHHVPDYLGVLPEFVRVLKPGGVVYIDHEASEQFWEQPQAFRSFRARASGTPRRSWLRFLSPRRYVSKFILTFLDPRYRPEGDIHVFPDDHIEWSKVEAVLEACGMEIIRSVDYLLFRRGYDQAVFLDNCGRLADTHYLVARKPE